MLCRALTVIFGRDTRPAQVINVAVSSLWGVAFILHTSSCVAVALPPSLVTHNIPLIWFLSAVVLFGVVGLWTRGRTHQVFKSFGLILGALSQAILANGYVTKFPPLDMQIIVCASLSVWFLLAVFYIFRCEGIDE